jgi:hypothetical protein
MFFLYYDTCILCRFIPVLEGVWIRTLDLAISSRELYPCATAACHFSVSFTLNSRNLNLALNRYPDPLFGGKSVLDAKCPC